MAVRASGTTLTEVFGVGPVIAATMIGYVADASRFPSRDHFAAYNGTAPIEVSSGNRKIYRLSRRGNRRLNHAVHMAAVTQIRYRHSDGRAYYDRKLAEGKTPKEALRCLKRRVSDAIYARLQADARRAAAFARTRGPGGQPGNDSVASAAGSHPENRLFGQATPEPATTLRPPNRTLTHPSGTGSEENPERLLTQRGFAMDGCQAASVAACGAPERGDLSPILALAADPRMLRLECAPQACPRTCPPAWRV